MDISEACKICEKYDTSNDELGIGWVCSEC